MHPDAPYFIILLCLTPDDFTHRGKSAATQWVNQTKQSASPSSYKATAFIMIVTFVYLFVGKKEIQQAAS